MSGSPQSLYRTHRPRTFEDVVGQEPVVRTLRNAVQRGKVHHAYLFVGSRGTGKTSMAKILAACLNCERGPTIEPCGECESCLGIARASSLDVIEMDAASHNSVDDIRELRESVAYAPVSGRQKVYILDEAHMLSQAAWNAFLKTLEEPPANTVFVLATTEAQKVPATVVDRCHRFDFHRPTVEQIASVLRRVAASESIEIPSEAVAAIARSATGSFRDALGTLEQLVTYSGSEIALPDVLAVLGVADAELLEEAFDAVSDGDTRGALLAIGRCVELGRDAGSFASDLEARARELLVVQTLGEVPAELSLTPEIDERLAEQAQRVGREVVVRMLELLGAAMEGVRAGGDSRTQLELALVKAARPDLDGSTRALLVRVQRLEARLESGSADASDPPIPGPQSPGPQSPETQSPETQSPETQSPETRRPDPISEPALTRAVPSIVASSRATAAAAPEPDRQGATVAPVAQVAPIAQPPTASPAPVAGDLDTLVSLWPAVLDTVRAENALLGALITEARLESLSDDDLTLGFAASAAFLKRKAEGPANRAILTEALRQITGRRLRLSYELREEISSDAEPDRAVPTEEEFLARLMAEFDAEELPEDWLPEQKGE